MKDNFLVRIFAFLVIAFIFWNDTSFTANLIYSVIMATLVVDNILMMKVANRGQIYKGMSIKLLKESFLRKVNPNKSPWIGAWFSLVLTVVISLFWSGNRLF